TVPDFKEPATIIGVVGDVKHRTPTEPAQPQLYLAHYQSPLIFSGLVARTAVPPLALTRDIRRAVWSDDKDQPMWSIAALDTILEGSRGSARFPNRDPRKRAEPREPSRIVSSAAID